MTDRTAAQLLADCGRSVFGTNWLTALSNRLPVSLRTLDRIAAAARDGGEYPTAARLLPDLHRVVTEEREALDVWLDAIEAAQARLKGPGDHPAK